VLLRRGLKPRVRQWGTLSALNKPYEEGDEIEINLRRGDIELLVEDCVLATRESAWTPPPPTRERGWLAQYSRLVQPIEKGATLVQPPSAPEQATSEVSSR
jgi:dihydroxy-acid dehydratase